MNKVEIPNFSPEQVRECIEGALAIVDELQPADDLRAAVFTEASRLLSSKQVLLEQMPAALPDLRRLGLQ